MFTDDHLHILACKAKDKEDRYIPVVDATFKALLQRRRPGPDGTELPSGAYAFGTPFGEVLSREQLNRAWRVTCAAANVVGLHLHDLRAEAASQLSEAGATVEQVRDALGHSST